MRRNDRRKKDPSLPSKKNGQSTRLFRPKRESVRKLSMWEQVCQRSTRGLHIPRLQASSYLRQRRIPFARQAYKLTRQRRSSETFVSSHPPRKEEREDNRCPRWPMQEEVLLIHRQPACGAKECTPFHLPQDIKAYRGKVLRRRLQVLKRSHQHDDDRRRRNKEANIQGPSGSRIEFRERKAKQAFNQRIYQKLRRRKVKRLPTRRHESVKHPTTWSPKVKGEARNSHQYSRTNPQANGRNRPTRRRATQLPCSPGQRREQRSKERLRLRCQKELNGQFCCRGPQSRPTDNVRPSQRAIGRFQASRRSHVQGQEVRFTANYVRREK